jgi:hypothetical protein
MHQKVNEKLKTNVTAKKSKLKEMSVKNFKDFIDNYK